MLRASVLASAILFGAALAANGVFMLVAPGNWYVAVPGVTSTGPFNQHFLRDIGLIFLFLGGAFLVGAARPRWRVLLWAAPTIWLAGHAVFHFWEMAVGICSASVIPRDFPAVTLPAIIGAVFTFWALARSRGEPAATGAAFHLSQPRRESA
ncbi:MAG: hypothetical protein J0H14_22425 [Alphaproteobacteria bacterium]|nr:hypothetical protein [Alphaproteobacteria bacterium]